MVGSLRTRHLVLGVLALVLGALAFAGCLGPGVGQERIAAYETTAIIRADDSVLVREVIDYDFGGEARHGIFRLIPTDLGTPLDVTVESDTAPDEVQVTPMGPDVELRVGDPDVEIRGRHRYVITYVLPRGVHGDRFALDAIGERWDVPSEEVRVTVLGAELADPRCFTGELRSIDRCPVEPDGDAYTSELDDLPAHHAVTIDGDVVEVRDATLPPLPPFEGRDGGARVAWSLIVVGLSVATSALVFVVCRHLGRNEVAGAGATEAAFVPFGEETFGPDREAPAAPPEVTLVADTEMPGLAGLDFVPPGGIEPWQAAVVLREKIDKATIGAWFSSQAGREILTLEDEGGAVVLRPGPRATEADPVAAPILNRALGGRERVPLGSYDSRFSTAWEEAGAAIAGWTQGAHIFRRRPPSYGGVATIGTSPPIACLIPALVFVFAGAGSAVFGGLRTGFAGVVVPIAVSLLAALIAYRRLTRSLTARGSAIALRSESFRRFLHDSEAQHVEWAWQNGLLREYSAWAVALGEAAAWSAALTAASIPPAEVATSTGVLSPGIHSHAYSSTTTEPSSSSSSGGGGGGFSGGGFSGGGGGGGGGGSW